ncbi:MAG: hypothetical protein D6696_18180 [Acidobacteria bacterium]|nr:MAG: hypothetical protein D6696_18180 [Acidobacteriota bacterium]
MDREPRSASWSDDLVDQLLPEDFDWRAKVRAYPLPALLVAAAAGFLLGRSRGNLLVSTLSSFAVDEASRNIAGVFGGRPEGD